MCRQLTGQIVDIRLQEDVPTHRLIGPFGTAAMSIVAFWTILMTYIGVNFVLTAGLHSYGFGQSSVTTWMAVLALAEILFLTAGLVAHNRRRSAGAGLQITS